MNPATRKGPLPRAFRDARARMGVAAMLSVTATAVGVSSPAHTC